MLCWEDEMGVGGRNVCGSNIIYCIHVLNYQRIKRTLKNNPIPHLNYVMASVD